MKTESYSRTEAVLGAERLNKIKASHVLIAGLGGVGGYALEALARMGVGEFTLIDSDSFELSNLNRQILSLSSNIGQKKAEVARQRVLEINHQAKVNSLCLFLDESNMDDVLLCKPTVVIDAIDSVPSKCLLLAKCKEKGIKVVSSMGAALHTDTTKVAIADISKTNTCPLAKRVRAGLRDFGIENGIPCVFSTEKVSMPQSKVLGSLPTVVGTFGLTLAYMAIELI